jgi:hypothetical protein
VLVRQSVEPLVALLKVGEEAAAFEEKEPGEKENEGDHRTGAAADNDGE